MAPNASQLVDAKFSGSVEVSPRANEASSAARYLSLLALSILILLHSSLALSALSSAFSPSSSMQLQVKLCPSGTRYGVSTYLMFFLVELVNISVHSYCLFLIWQRKLDAQHHADWVLAISCCWPAINFTGALTIPGFLDNKNMATFFCLIVPIAVLMGLPPTHSFAQVVFGSPIFVLLDFLSVMRNQNLSVGSHLGRSILIYMLTRGPLIPIAGIFCSLCASVAVTSGQNTLSSATAATMEKSDSQSQLIRPDFLPFESFGFDHPNWTRSILLRVKQIVKMLSGRKYSSLILCGIAFPIFIYHAVLGLGARFLPIFEVYLRRITGDQICITLLAAFVLGRDSRNLDISYLLQSLNDARNRMFTSVSQRPSATDLIDSVRRQVAESGEVAGDKEAGEDDVTALEVLGEGSYGKVFKGTWRGTVVAIKTMALPAESSSSERHERLAIMEAAISSALSHPHIVQLYTYSLRPCSTAVGFQSASTDKLGTGSHSSSSGPLMGMEMRLIQEHMDRGCLYDALVNGLFSSTSDAGLFNYRAVLETAADVARAMIHVHSLNILHNDVKARNVLLKSNERDPRGVTCKLGDFGLAMKTDGSQEAKGICGTLTHLAPETIRDSVKSKATDVYAYGILLHEIMCPGELYVDTNRSFLRHAVTLGKRPEFPPSVPIGYIHLASSCWDADPKLRPSFKEILRILLDLIADEENKSTVLRIRPTSSPVHQRPENVNSKEVVRRNETSSKGQAHPTSPLVCDGTFDFHGSGVFLGSMVDEGSEAPKQDVQQPSNQHGSSLDKMLANKVILMKSVDETMR